MMMTMQEVDNEKKESQLNTKPRVSFGHSMIRSVWMYQPQIKKLHLQQSVYSPVFLVHLRH